MEGALFAATFPANIPFISHFQQLDPANYEGEEGTFNKLRKERGYNYSDVITVSPEKLPNYEQKVLLDRHYRLNHNSKLYCLHFYMQQLQLPIQIG